LILLLTLFIASWSWVRSASIWYVRCQVLLSYHRTGMERCNPGQAMTDWCRDHSSALSAFWVCPSSFCSFSSIVIFIGLFRNSAVLGFIPYLSGSHKELDLHENVSDALVQPGLGGVADLLQRACADLNGCGPACGGESQAPERRVLFSARLQIVCRNNVLQEHPTAGTGRTIRARRTEAPAGAPLIRVDGRNRWEATIQNASMSAAAV